MDFLKRNLGLKILSISLAIFLWAYVKYSQNPYASITSGAEVRVPLTIEGKDEKLVVLDMPSDVKLLIRGSSEILDHVDSTHFKAFVDVSDKKAGQYHLKVRVLPPHGIKPVSIQPQMVDIRLDPEERRLFNVKVKPQGTISSGFILGVPSSSPESVTLRGAQSILAQVKEVQAVCDVEGADMDRIQQIAVEAVDENGKMVENLAIEPRFVRVNIKIKSEAAEGNIPITPNLTGNPADGYVIEKVELKPPTAAIRYRYDMDSPPNLLLTEAISIEGIQESIEKEAELIIPKDVVLVSPEKTLLIIKISVKKSYEFEKVEGAKPYLSTTKYIKIPIFIGFFYCIIIKVIQKPEEKED